MVKPTAKQILDLLPYSKPFLFVDEIEKINEEGVTGFFTFDPELDFYKGHFKDKPITPGVILTETMAQVGLVCLGIFLLSGEENEFGGQVAMTSSNVEFLRPVFPGEKVTVISEKIYFRFNKLKCRITMQNEGGDKVCYGELAGMFIKNANG
ncbi:3-hydroxyacyl-ACP dehydratase FabZ family protein [Pedobacter sp. CFBP9032]|uniref:3-hydroxyacyl-ACP dehydratase FabZ family protein n=1 Tax=Pedobacter sp. CFBP9032 TaxID=3096539 RepID=UPI002A6B5B7D|nr:3-hydroxyacyl-ACP dehydratase FabZ family protein [Pedobacter sp. CFBP9032]MDY0903396.1 3-hydroxyacyl-ACP dehydratase FabZ family protein [Pedobacter sp. CFBP9032]